MIYIPGFQTFHKINSAYCEILHDFLPSAGFFQNQLFLKILSGILSECQTVWIQIRPDILSGLIWVQTVCKGILQTTLLGKEIMMSPWNIRFNVNSYTSRQRNNDVPMEYRIQC